jgi:hypothetical protein
MNDTIVSSLDRKIASLALRGLAHPKVKELTFEDQRRIVGFIDELIGEVTHEKIAELGGWDHAFDDNLVRIRSMGEKARSIVWRWLPSESNYTEFHAEYLVCRD